MLPTLNLKQLEALAIKEALALNNGSVVKAARTLGIGRATLYRKLSDKPRKPKIDPRQLKLEGLDGSNGEDQASETEESSPSTVRSRS
jgi:hypothetical protein